VKLIQKTTVTELQGSVSGWALNCVIASDKLAHQIIDLDKGTRSSGREKALWKNTAAITEKRIADGAVGLASLWLTAYIKAGSPALPGDVTLPEGETPKGGGDDSEREDGADEPT